MVKTAPQKELAKQTLRLYWQHAWSYKPFVIGIAIVVPITILVFNFLPPLILANMLARISEGDFTKHDLWGSFGSSLISYAAINILGAIVLWRLAIILIWKLEIHVLQDLHQRIFQHLLSLSSSFHANRFGGSLVSQANKFASAYIRIADTLVFEVFTMLMAFVFTAVILWPKSPWVVIILLGFSVVYMLISIFATKRVRELNTIEASKSNQQTGYLADAITNVMAVITRE